MHPSVKELYTNELREIDAELSNIADRVTELLETQKTDAIATAFSHAINDAQTILRLAIKLSKRESPRT